MRIAVAGGTGVVGTRVVRVAAERGHDTVVVTRSNGVDLVTGSGLSEALAGADAVIDASSVQTGDSRESRQFFEAATRNLLDSSVPHLVVLSIIGAAEIDDGYYAGKARQERMLQSEPGGWTLLRTAQFHEFAQQALARGRVGPLCVAPRMRSEPIAAADVAEALVIIAEGPPRQVVPDLAGPKEERMSRLVRAVARAAGSRRPVIEVPLPGRFGKGIRDGSLLAGPGATRSRLTFEEWLAARDHER